MRYRRKYLFITLALSLSLIGLQAPVRSFIASTVWRVTGDSSQSVSSLGRQTRSFFSIFQEISNLRDQNKELEKKITGLEIDRSLIKELEQENSLLKRELGFIEENKDEELIPAKIVEREPTTFRDSVIVDRGSGDGVLPKMAVVSGGVLVGQVAEVYQNQAKIILVTSKDSIVQAMMQNSRAKGILRGGISGLYLENISQDVDFAPGEYVVTSGLGGTLKQGILIGEAKESQSYFSGIFKNIFVEPVADLSKLELVFIVK